MTTTMDFRRWQKDHPNFMTPTLIRVQKIGSTFVELSEGSGLETDSKIYGVTVLEENGENSFVSTRDKRVNMVFHDLDKARAHFSDVCWRLM